MSHHELNILVSDGTKHVIKEYNGNNEKIKDFRKKICLLLNVTDDMIRYELVFVLFGGKRSGI